MASTTRTLSITRPNAPVTDYGKHTWQYYAGPALAVAAVMLLSVLFVITAVIAGWVSQLSDPARAAAHASRLVRVQTYQAWLLPVAVAAIALTKLGIAVTLWGIVRRLWIRVERSRNRCRRLSSRTAAHCKRRYIHDNRNSIGTPHEVRDGAV